MRTFAVCASRAARAAVRCPLCAALVGIALEEGGFDDQGIGAANFLQQLVGIGGITDHDHPGAGLRGPQNFVRRDPAPVRQDNCFAPEQATPLWPCRNVERGEPFRQHARTRLLLEREAERVGASVRHRKRLALEI